MVEWHLRRFPTLKELNFAHSTPSELGHHLLSTPRLASRVIEIQSLRDFRHKKEVGYHNFKPFPV